MEQEWLNVVSNRKIKKFHFEIMDFLHLILYDVSLLVLEMSGDAIDKFWELVSFSAHPHTRT